MSVPNRNVLVSIIVLLVISISINTYLITLLFNNIVDTGRNTTTTGSYETNTRRSGGILYLAPPPVEAIGPVTANDDTGEIPPIDTTNIFVIAYYNVGQEINLTKVHENLQGLIVDYWGGSYFDGTYYFIDPKVPENVGELLENATVKIHVRVRSDGWVLSWITKNQSLTDIVMSGLRLPGEVGDKQPWVNKSITTLSYTIYKILVAAELANETDSDNDGFPDDLVKISRNTGYYDYKYCGPAGKEGFLAIVGVKAEYVYNSQSPFDKSVEKQFDIVIGGAYQVKEYSLMLNYYLRTTAHGNAYFHVAYGNLSETNKIFEDSINGYRNKKYARVNIDTFNLTSGEPYVFKLKIRVWNEWWGPVSEGYCAIELFLVVLGVVGQD